MRNVAYKIIPDPSKNTLTYSKNYRIFSADEPLDGAIKITAFTEDIELGSGTLNYISRKFRYSFDKGNWSLWYNLDPTSLGDILFLEFNDKPVFFEVKYEYDDTTYNSLTTPVSINNCRFTVVSSTVGESLFSPSIYCSAEKCPAVIATQDPSFKPYDVGTAIGIAKELSFNTNLIFGHDVVYFKTEPDREGGDFIFKEWTLFKTTSRKCAKIMVPNNVFPDNKPNFQEFGVDFEIPFEVHVDHVYFQTVFGPGTQPRKRDYMYFPLTNRMYEIQGSYLFRGFMMEPIYWKIQLTRFHPNADMIMKPEDKKFLDNLILTSDQLFGAQAKVQSIDAQSPQQFKTISSKFDETRQSLHPDINNKILDFTYNYGKLIEYYYDLSKVRPTVVSYDLVNNGNSTDTVLSGNPIVCLAYEDSQIYEAWRNNALTTGDSIIEPSVTLPIKMNGPKDSHNSSLKHYVQIEAYKNLSMKSADSRNIVENPTGVLKFNQMERAIIYKSIASTIKTPSMTFTALVKFNKGSQTIKILDGYDNLLGQGLVISGSLTDSSGIPSVSMFININGTTYTFPVGNLAYDTWYSLIIPISSIYGQIEVNVYSFTQDPSNVKNYNGVTQVYNNSMNIGPFGFDTSQNWSIPGANYSICNIRLFNTMIQEEDHEFVISQLFVRDESMLEIIDNARPRLNQPFVATNK